jgi:uncharacterized membrane protein YqhA
MADPLREAGSASPEGSTGPGSSQSEAAPAEASGAEEAGPLLERGFERVLSLSRLVVVIPVIVLLLAAISSFVYGTDVFIRSVARVVKDPTLSSHNLGFLLLLTDLFLVGATLMIAGFGFYDLFITSGHASPSLRLPAWLRMRDLNDLKARVISMIILVAAVSFADVAVESGGGLSTLYLGGAVALVIAALTAFLHFSR